MNNLKEVNRRTNVALVWGGLFCLLLSVAVAVAIWTQPFSGPDLRTEFIMPLIPGVIIGVVFSLWGFFELQAGKKRDW